MKLIVIVIAILAAILTGCSAASNSQPVPTTKVQSPIVVSQPPSGDDRFLLLKLKESHFSLDIGKHIKNSMNAVEFIMPVSKAYYDEVSVGQNILEGKGFRGASLFFSGSISDYTLTIVDKQDSITKFKK